MDVRDIDHYSAAITMPKFTPKKILIVDEDVRSMATMAQTLLRNGYQVLHAADEVKAVKVSKKDRPDLIICNSESKKLDIREFLKSLQTGRPTHTIPFLLITDSKHSHNDPPGNLAPKQHLSKPFTREQLTIAVQENLKPLLPKKL